VQIIAAEEKMTIKFGKKKITERLYCAKLPSTLAVQSSAPIMDEKTLEASLGIETRSGSFATLSTKFTAQ
jgi:hypothetical protein